MAAVTRSRGIDMGMMTAGGGMVGATGALDAAVSAAAEALSAAMERDVSIRFNSNRKGGGAWLVVDAEDRIGRNAEVGITYSSDSLDATKVYGPTLVVTSVAAKDNRTHYVTLNSLAEALEALRDLAWTMDGGALAKKVHDEREAEVHRVTVYTEAGAVDVVITPAGPESSSGEREWLASSPEGDSLGSMTSLGGRDWLSAKRADGEEMVTSGTLKGLLLKFLVR